MNKLLMKKKHLFIIAFAFCLSSLLFLYLVPSSISSLRYWIYDGNGSDFLFPFSIYQAILTQGATDFVFGAYTAYLDIIAGFFIWMIFPNPNIVLVIILVLQLILVSLSLLYLSHHVFGRNTSVLAVVLTFSAIPTFAYAVGWFREYPYFFSWYFHISTMFTGFFAMGIVFYLLFFSQGKARTSFWLHVAALCVITILTTTSDALFIPQFIAPLLGVIFFAALLSIVRVRVAIVTALSLIFSMGIGIAIYDLPTMWGSERVQLNNLHINISIEQIAENASLFASNLAVFWNGNNWGWIVWAAFYFLCLVLSIGFIKQWLRQRTGHIKKRLLLMLLFCLLQALSIISSVLLTGNTVNRYFLLVFFVPFFWGWPYLLFLSRSFVRLLSKKWVVVVGYVGMVISILAVLWLFVTRGASNLANYSPPFVACVDEQLSPYMVDRGIAPYWQARPLTLFSRQAIKTVQVDGSLQPFRFLNTSDYYHDEFDFLIIDFSSAPLFKIDPEVVIHRFGEPSNRFTCASSEIWLYNRATDIDFRDQFDVFLGNGGSLDKVGEEKSLPGALLFTLVGEKYRNEIVTNQELTPGILSFGPYWPVTPGSYKFEINYVSDAPEGNIPGTWDVVTVDEAGENIITSQQLLKGDLIAGEEAIDGKFSIDRGTRIEIRTFSNGAARIAIQSISLKRVGD